MFLDANMQYVYYIMNEKKTEIFEGVLLSLFIILDFNNFIL